MSNIIQSNSPGLDTDQILRDGSPGRTVSEAAYVLQQDDSGRALRAVRAGGATITIPTNATVPFPIGAVVLVDRSTAADVTVVGASGVVIDVLPTENMSPGFRQGWHAVLQKIGIDRWTLKGDLTLP